MPRAAASIINDRNERGALARPSLPAPAPPDARARQTSPLGDDDGSRADVQDLELSIVMPCLNEAETLETCIQKASSSLRRHGIRGEIVVSDNGSSDGCREIAARLGARVVTVETRGYGAALLGGIEAARGKYIIMGDADDSYDFSDLMPFLEKLREGHDVVLGNRFRGRIKPGAMPPLHRYLGNPILSGLGRLLFHSAAGDFHCGLRGLTKKAAIDMDLHTTGMEFASEMIVKATLRGMKVTEIPTTLSPDGRSRPPHLETWSDGWRHLRFLLLYSPRWLFLYPGTLLLFLGLLAAGCVLTRAWPASRHMVNDGTLVYCAAAILLGFQAITFAMLSNLFARVHGLRPDDPQLRRVFPLGSVETGLIVGSVLAAVGLGGTILAARDWAALANSQPDLWPALRLLIPAATALTLGCQVIFASFFRGVLGMAPPREPSLTPGKRVATRRQRPTRATRPT